MEKFLNINKRDSIVVDNKYDKYESLAIDVIDKIQNLKELLFKNHNSFEKGLFRIHTLGSSFYWTEIVTEYFKKHKGKVYCFAFDWMGRQFAIDLKGKNLIYMFDYATGESFIMAQTLNGFFEEDLFTYREDTLLVDLFENFFVKEKRSFLEFDECITFKQPLFTGGEDNIENMEIGDIEVNWEINYQLFCKINKLSNNTLIKDISIED